MDRKACIYELLHVVWCISVSYFGVTYSTSTWMPFFADLLISIDVRDVWYMFLQDTPNIDYSISLSAPLK